MVYERLNLSRIREKIADIKEALAILRSYARREEKEFLNNSEAVRAARYTFIVLIEAATNIANHLCARLLNKAPASYAESFLLLGEHNLLDRELAQRLGKMTGFRNLLVHGYGKIDDSKMFKIMCEDLGDLEAFLEAMQYIIEKSGGENES